MQRFTIVAALAALTVAGFLWFPGHTYLYQDTQIWVPVMEWMADHNVLSKDFLLDAAHMRLTLYDDLAVGLKRLTGADLQTVLQGLQILFRFAGLLGIYLLARAVALAPAWSVLAAALFGMSAFSLGPAVISIELEPVPRGFAFPLTLLGLGCIAHNRERLGGIAIAAGFLFHAPAVWPVLLIRPFRRKLLEPLAVAGLILVLSAALERSSHMNPLFGAIAPAHEELQRMRASYNWINTWAGRFLMQYVWLALAAAAAYWRLRWDLPEAIKPYCKWLPLMGLACVPLSYLLLDQWKWNLIPQIQPMRTLLYTLVIALVLCSLAGLRAAAKGNWWEAPLWLFLPCLAPLSPELAKGPYTIPALLALALTALVLLGRRWPVLMPVNTAAACALLVFAPVHWAKVKNYPTLETPALAELITWASTKTAPQATFVFRDYGRRDPNHAGLFRSRALRALFVDFKGGGQVNYYEKWSYEWWRRWQMVEKPFAPGELPQWRSEKVDYLIFKKPPPGLTPVFANQTYTVVAVP